MSTTAKVWGNTSFKSCDGLIERIKRNELEDLIILPNKIFGDNELNRLSYILEQQQQQQSTAENNNKYYQLRWHTISASGHTVSSDALQRFGNAIAMMITSVTQRQEKLWSIAIGTPSTCDDGINALIDGLFCNSNATTSIRLNCLDLSYKGMSIIGLHALVTRLNETSSFIQRLILSRNNFSLCTASKNNNKNDITWPSEFNNIFDNVHELDLSDCQIDSDLALSLFRNKLISLSNSSSNNCTKNDDGREKILHISNNPLLTDIGFKQIIQNVERLNELYISNCNLTDNSITYISSTSDESINIKCITILDISNNNITLSNDIIQQELCLLKNLHELNISGNPLGSDGIHTLCKSLSSSIRILDISETQCTATGAVFAIQHLYQCVQSLRLYNNQIGNGFHDIANALEVIFIKDTATSLMWRIETLDLAGNSAKKESVIALLSSILKIISTNANNLSCLKCLVIGGNETSGREVEEIIKSIQQIRPNLDIAKDKR